MIAMGATMVSLGMLFLGPQPLLMSMLGLHRDGGGLDKYAVRLWLEQVIAIIVNGSGQAMVFVPALPLLQSEVQHFGFSAAEEVIPLFLGALSVGEVVGPIA